MKPMLGLSETQKYLIFNEQQLFMDNMPNPLYLKKHHEQDLWVTNLYGQLLINNETLINRDWQTLGYQIQEVANKLSKYGYEITGKLYDNNES